MEWAFTLGAVSVLAARWWCSPPKYFLNPGDHLAPGLYFGQWWTQGGAAKFEKTLQKCPLGCPYGR